MTGELLVTYRPYESRDVAARIGARLAASFSRNRVAFGSQLRSDRLAAPRAVVALLGPDPTADGAWLSSLHAAARGGVPVLLAFMDGVRSGEQRPDPAIPANPYGLEFSTIHFDRDVEKLIAALSRILESGAAEGIAIGAERAAQEEAPAFPDAEAPSVEKLIQQAHAFPQTIEAESFRRGGDLNFSGSRGAPPPARTDSADVDALLDRSSSASLRSRGGFALDARANEGVEVDGHTPLGQEPARASAASPARDPPPPPPPFRGPPILPTPGSPRAARPPGFGVWPPPIPAPAPDIPPAYFPLPEAPPSAAARAKFGEQLSSVRYPRGLEPPRGDDGYRDSPTLWRFVAAALGLAAVAAFAFALAFVFRHQIVAFFGSFAGALLRGPLFQGATLSLSLAASRSFPPQSRRPERDER